MKRKDIDAALAGRLAQTLRQHGPLAGLAADAAVSLIKLGTLVELEPGEALIREDEEAAREIYLLVEGALVVKSTSGTVARLDRPGDVVGEVAVLLSSKRTADVIADSAARVLAISAKALDLPEYAEVASAVGGAMLRDDWIKY